MKYATQLFGRTVAADCYLPGVPAAGSVDLVIQEKVGWYDSLEVKWCPSTGDAGGWPWVGFADGSFVFSVDDGFVSRHEQGSNLVVYENRAALDDATVVHLLADHVIPRVLAHDGARILHGSAIARTDRALIFVGPSGSGKSTTASALLARGCVLLGDDAAALASKDSKAEGWQVLPAYPALRMYEDAAVATLNSPVLGSTVATWTAKRHLTAGENGFQFSTQAIDVSAVIVLAAGRSDPALERVHPSDAFVELAKHSFDIWPPDTANGLALLDRWASVAADVPMFRLFRPPLDSSFGTAVEDLVLGALG
jgi:hypothetical protein